jgi:hypothetical protein
LGGGCAGEAQQEFEVGDDGLARVEFPLRLKPVDQKPLRGRILAPDGTPVTGASVNLQLNVEDEGACWPGDPESQNSRADGTFTFPAVTDGTYKLSVSHPWFLPFETQVRRTPERVDIRLVSGATLAGTVQLPGGQPARACSVWLRSQKGREHFARCDTEGRFLLKALPNVPYNVTVFGRSQPDNEQERGEDFAWSPSVPDGENTLTVEFQSGDATFRGRVTRANGAPAVEAGVKANQEGVNDPNFVGTSFVSARADADGNFVLEHIPPGRWKVMAYERGVPSNTVVVTVPGDTPPLMLRLEQ